MLFMALHQLMVYLQISGVLNSYPHLLGVSFPFPVLQGLMLFIYVSEITANKFKHSWYVYIHLLPALSLVLLAIPFYLLSPDEKIWVFENEGKGFEWYMVYIDLLIGISGCVYSVWSLILIKRFRYRIKDSLSNTDKKELKWLQYLSIAFGIIWVLSFFVDNSIIYPAVVILIIFIGFFGINQMDIFYTRIPLAAAEIENASDSIMEPIELSIKRYAKSGLNKEQAKELYSKLQDAMQKEALYEDPNLTLKDLANKLDISGNYLSQIINEIEGVNFYTYVNNLRIQSFLIKMKLPENKKYTLMSVAHDCGFRNKSTFNRHFKRINGQTPSEYFNTSQEFAERQALNEND